MRKLLTALRDTGDVSVLHVTHDQQEATAMAHTIWHMECGVLSQNQARRTMSCIEVELMTQIKAAAGCSGLGDRVWCADAGVECAGDGDRPLWRA